MNNVLRTQLEGYRDAAWSIDHRRAMECHDLEDWLDLGLALFEAIRRIDQRCRDRFRSGEFPFQKEVVEETHRLFEVWYSSCDSLLRRIDQFERDGYRIENAEEFRLACRSSPMTGLEPERLGAAAEQFERGPGRPLTEVMDGIRRRMVG